MIYPDTMARVHVIVVNLEESALKCLLSLHDENAPELENLDPYMQGLRERLKSPQQPGTEACIDALKQGKRLVMEYIQDFHYLVSHLGDWPDCLMVYHFRQTEQKTVPELPTLGRCCATCKHGTMWPLR